MDAKKPDDRPQEARRRLSEVERPGELAAQLCEGSAGFCRVLGLGHLALELCDARAHRPELRAELGFGSRLHRRRLHEVIGKPMDRERAIRRIRASGSDQYDSHKGRLRSLTPRSKTIPSWRLRCCRTRGAAARFPIKANPPRDGDAKPRVRPRA